MAEVGAEIGKRIHQLGKAKSAADVDETGISLEVLL